MVVLVLVVEVVMVEVVILILFTSQIALNMPWRKARKLIKEDVRYKNFTDSDHVSTCVLGGEGLG